MLPAVSVAAGSDVVPRMSRSPCVVAVTLKGTPVSGTAPSPMSMMQTPVKTITVIVPALSATYSAPPAVGGGVNSTVTVPVTITNAGTSTWQPG